MDQVATNTYVALTEALSFVRPELLATDGKRLRNI